MNNKEKYIIGDTLTAFPKFEDGNVTFRVSGFFVSKISSVKWKIDMFLPSYNTNLYIEKDEAVYRTRCILTEKKSVWENYH